MKYRFIIVDDETFTLKHLANSLDWESIGFELVATFDTATDVVPFLEKNRIDVVLSDIAMPELSGLDLLGLIKEKFPHILVVLLSGYRKFEYAQKAISYGVFDYLTKPINYTSLLDVFNRLKVKLDENNSNNDDFLLLSRQQMLCDYFLGHVTADSMNSYFRDFNTCCSVDNPVCLINIKIESLTDYLSNTFLHGKDRLYNALINLIEVPYTFIAPLNYSNDNIEIVLFSEKNSQTEFKEIINEFCKEFPVLCLSTIKATISINKTIVCSSLEALSLQLNKTLSHTFSLDNGSVVAYDVISKAKQFLQVNFAKDITLFDIAEYLGLHPTYVSKLFKQETGEKYIDYLIRIRVDKAKQLLLSNKHTIDEIYQMVGYRSKKYFYKIFKLSTGMAPQEYRLHMLKNKDDNI